MRTYLAFALAAVSIALGLALDVAYWTGSPGLIALLIAALDTRGTPRTDTRRQGVNWSSLVCGGLGVLLAFV